MSRNFSAPGKLKQAARFEGKEFGRSCSVYEWFKRFAWHELSIRRD
jgi:hypothetical protein